MDPSLDPTNRHQTKPDVSNRVKSGGESLEMQTQQHRATPLGTDPGDFQDRCLCRRLLGRLNVSGMDIARPNRVAVENGREVLLHGSPGITVKMKCPSPRSVHYEVSDLKRRQADRFMHQPLMNRYKASFYLDDIAPKVSFDKLVASRRGFVQERHLLRYR